MVVANYFIGYVILAHSAPIEWNYEGNYLAQSEMRYIAQNAGFAERTNERTDVDVTVLRYLDNPPTAQKLAQLYRDAGIAPQQGLRIRGTDAVERGLPDADDATILAAMAAEPALIERPLVETDKGVRLCRPQEAVLEIL